jgi:hypothetical protein
MGMGREIHRNELGDGTLINKSVPTQINSNNTGTRYLVTNLHCDKNDGTLWTWDGTTKGMGMEPTVTKIQNR